MGLLRNLPLALAAHFFAAGMLAWAQSEAGTGTVNGTVTDPSGAAVSNARVTATNRDTGLIRESTTTEAGVYTFVRLPVGVYKLRYDFQGFKTAERPDVPVNVGAVATVDLMLQVGQATESVTITSEVPVVETTRSQASTLVGEKLIRDLPINGRNFLDFTILTPGVVRDPRGGDLSFGGQRGTMNSFMIDGTDSNNLFFGQSTGRQGVRNPYAVSQDAVQEFQVNTNGYAPEIGRAAGGVVNVITKSGTNELHGSAFWFLRRTSWTANNSFQKSLNRARPLYEFDQFGGNVGGPVKRDKLFYFFNYDGQRNEEPIVMFTPAVRPTDAPGAAEFDALTRRFGNYARGLNNNVYLSKVDWNIASGKTLNLRWNANRFTGRNYENAGAQRLAESTGDSKVTTDTIGATYTHVIGSRDVLDVRTVYVRDDQPGAANSEAPETTIRQGGQNVIVFGRNNFSPRYTNSKRNQFVSTLTTVRGQHTIKFGGDLNFERIANFFPGQFSGVYLFNSIADWMARRPAQFSQALAGPGTDGALTRPDISEYAFFLQDSWRATDRLTVNYGVRYDLMNTADPPVANPTQALTAAGYRTDTMPLDKNNWAPRVGLAYRVTRDERMVLRAGYGVFYGRTPAILTGTVHSQNGIQVQNYSFTTNIPVTYPNILSAPPAVNRTPNIFVFERGYQQPSTQQWSAQAEMRIAAGYALTAGYLGVRGYHLTRSRDMNLFPAATATAQVAGGGGTLQFDRFGAARPNGAFGRITLVESGADSRYNGVFFQLSKRFSQSYTLQTSYTLSKVTDTAPEATAVLPGNAGDDAKIAQNTLQPNLDRGLGDSDARHRLVVSGVWDIHYANGMTGAGKYILGGWQLATIVQAQSGRVYSERVNIDLNNDGNFNSDRAPGGVRNALRLPAFVSADLRLSKDIPVGGERVRVKFIAEAFNFTNRTNITGRNGVRYNVALPPAGGTLFTATPNGAFGAVTSSGDPRIFQLALKVLF
ncbi:MAG: TonB-dependent receptor [Bryobacterales bacterium]|nr:TonB-dependent receptor [Bryobacterales bacterium]